MAKAITFRKVEERNVVEFMITNWLDKKKIINSEYGEVPARVWLINEWKRIGNDICFLAENSTGKIGLCKRG